MKTSQMLKVIPIATLALLMSCSGNKSEEATETQNVQKEKKFHERRRRAWSTYVV